MRHKCNACTPNSSRCDTNVTFACPLGCSGAAVSESCAAAVSSGGSDWLSLSALASYPSGYYWAVAGGVVVAAVA
eukprot:6724895-Pyramimonas_sp.AAC.1